MDIWIYLCLLVSAKWSMFGCLEGKADQKDEVQSIQDNQDYQDYGCDFTDGMCRWKNVGSSSSDWTRVQGRAISNNVEFSLHKSHTTGATGWYLLIQTKSSQNQLSEAAQFHSPMISIAEESCFSFWFYIDGTTVGEFAVIKKSKKKGMSTVVWNEVTTGVPTWRHGLVKLSPGEDFQLILAGKYKQGLDSDGIIAIDDLKVSRGACPPRDECTFETDLCGWNMKGGSTVKWIRQKPKPTQTRAVPSKDHTRNNKKGFFINSYQSPTGGSGNPIFYSAKFPPTKSTRCFTFWYMCQHGRVKLSLKGATTKTIWEMPVADFNRWKLAEIDINSETSFTLEFETPRYVSGGAIDDIMFLDGKCKPPGVCDFERNTCGYLDQKNMDDFDWSIGSGQISSDNGPPIDHTSSSQYGQYIYLPFTNEESFDTAVITSYKINVAGASKCLGFWYFMQGKDAGSLKVQMEVIGKSTTTLWQVNNQDTSKWTYAQVPLISRKQIIQIHFIGVRGFNKQAKIAVDDVTFKDGETSCGVIPANAEPMGCNFETGLCRWYQDKSDALDWLFINESTYDRPSFAPYKDHTTVTKQGSFIFFYALMSRNEKDGSASLILDLKPWFKKATGKAIPYCLSFSRLDNGRSRKPPLTVLTQSSDPQEGTTVLWRGTEDTRYGWIDEHIQLNVKNENKVIIKTERKEESVGWHAIDDIEVAYGDCKNTEFCTFESSDICNWQKLRYGLQWTRRSVTTAGVDISLSGDHTYGSKYGHFMFIDFNKLSDRQTVKLRTNIFKREKRRNHICVQFFYHMSVVGGSEVGPEENTLTVYSGRKHVFQQSGSHPGWNEAGFRIEAGRRFHFTIEAKKEGSASGVVAIDDFKISDINEGSSCP